MFGREKLTKFKSRAFRTPACWRDLWNDNFNSGGRILKQQMPKRVELQGGVSELAPWAKEQNLRLKKTWCVVLPYFELYILSYPSLSLFCSQQKIMHFGMVYKMCCNHVDQTDHGIKILVFRGEAGWLTDPAQGYSSKANSSLINLYMTIRHSQG